MTMPFSFAKVPLVKSISVGRRTRLVVNKPSPPSKPSPDSDNPFNYPIAQDWSKPFSERVLKARTNRQQWNEAQLATLEAVVRRLVRQGWVRRRTSTSKRNQRATSRYLRRGTYEIRISDHHLPYRKWLHDYVITDKIMQTHNVISIIQWIERDHLLGQSALQNAFAAVTSRQA